MRTDRKKDRERPCEILCNFMENAQGSCLISFGKTRVFCTCSVEQGVPDFKRGSGSGWLTAEYAMLPGSTQTRKKRDGIKKDGRGVEIQRLIGRALRQAVDLDKLGDLTLTLDCDVIQADGGTRTASITGAYVALALAVDKLLRQGVLAENPIVCQVAALSAGIVQGEPMVDLCYQEDSRADADINVVMNDRGELIEIQGTGERLPFSLETLTGILKKTRVAILRLMQAQREALKAAGVRYLPKLCLAVATGNKHKLAELNELLGGRYNLFDLDFLGFTEDIVEDGESFAENSVIKSRTVYKTLGLPTIADDSGLCVKTLQGAPGIHSARYGGAGLSAHDKNMLLLKELDGAEDRTAHFSCCMSVAGLSGEEQVFEGICRGSIADREYGSNGFGYDPIFRLEDGRFLGEMRAEEKNSISHRANAVRLLDEYLEKI